MDLCSASAIQPISFFLIYSTCYLSLCTSAKQLLCEPRNVLQSGPRFDFIQLSVSFRFGTYAAPLPSSSLWTYAAPLPSSPFLSLSLFLLLYVKTFNSGSFHGTNRHTLNDSVHHAQIKTFKLKLQISNPRFPLLLLSLSHNQRTNYATALLSQDTLQSSNAANLVELHASFLVVQDVTNAAQGSQRNPPGSNNTTNILFTNYTGNHRYEDHKARLTAKLACRYLHVHLSISRGTTRYSCSKPKGEYLHSNYLHTKFS